LAEIFKVPIYESLPEVFFLPIYELLPVNRLTFPLAKESFLSVKSKGSSAIHDIKIEIKVRVGVRKLFLPPTSALTLTLSESERS